VPRAVEDDSFVCYEQSIGADSAALIEATGREVGGFEGNGKESNRAWLVIWQRITSSPARVASTNAGRRFVC